MYLIVGLGNPGREYEHSHHNMGFDVVDKFADSLGVAFDRSDFKGLYVKARYMDKDLIILKPQTYMNLSGESIIQVLNFYKIPVENMIVVYDDMDTPLGHIKLKIKGSSGGHNGIKSIIANIGTQEFNRVKVGIGHPNSKNIIDYVLKKPSKEEEPLIETYGKEEIERLKREEPELYISLRNNAAFMPSDVITDEKKEEKEFKVKKSEVLYND